MAKSRIIKPNSPRKQHIISELYLTPFANTEGNLFVHESGKPIRKSVPSREATERDFFEYEIPREKSNYQLEKMLSRLETFAKPVHTKLLNGESCSIKEEILAWSFFVSSTFLRSRRIRNELSVKSLENDEADWFSNEHIREMQYEILMNYGRLIPSDEIARAAKNAHDEYQVPGFRHAQAIRNSTSKFAFVLSQMRWQVVEVDEGSFFATCDAPVLSFQLRGNQLFDGYGWGLPDVHVALTISPKQMFVASPPNIQWAPKLDVHDAALINLVVTRFADRYVYADRKSEELKSGLEADGRRLAFGDTAFRVNKP